MSSIAKNIICLLLCLFLLLSATACGSSAIASTEEEAKVVGTCGDYEVKYEELRYIANICVEEMKSRYGENIFADPTSAEGYEQELADNIAELLCESYAILAVCQEADIAPSDRAIRREVQEYVDETVELLGGQEEYMEYLKVSFMTDAVFRLYAAIVSCQYRYFDELAPTIEKESYDATLSQDGFIHTLSVFVKNDAGENIDYNREIADEISRAVTAGEKTLESYVGSRYNQDTSGCEYYFVRGYMDEAYEDAAFALAEGEVSGAVETREGFYVIKRLPSDAAYVENHLDELMQIYQIAAMNRILAEKRATLSFALNEEGKTLTLWNLK